MADKALSCKCMLKQNRTKIYIFNILFLNMILDFSQSKSIEA